MRVFVVVLFSLFSLAPTAQVTLDSTVLEVDTLWSGYDIPWEIRLAPDSSLWVTERYGRFTRYDLATGDIDTLLDRSGSIYASGEAGMLGFAFGPGFSGTGSSTDSVFLVYCFVQNSTIYERLSVFQYDGDDLINETILLDTLPASSIHNGSRVHFLDDGTLLMTTGEKGTPFLAQDFYSLGGKVLRLNPDGTIPADNPFPGSYVYSLGHRNPQGLELMANGDILISEHGPSTDDEFQRIIPGRNYGWPFVEGMCDLSGEQLFCADSNVVEPLWHWTPTIAPSDLKYYPYPHIPEWEGKVLMGVLKERMVVAIEYDPISQTADTAINYLENQFGRIRDIEVDGAGNVYLATNGEFWNNTNPFTHAIIRLSPPNTTGYQQHSKLQWNVYPNPVSDMLYITIPGRTGMIRIRSLTGSILHEGPLNDHGSVSFRGAASGVYIVEFTNASTYEARKIICVGP